MDWKPSTILMPLAFASILGGMNTKIGTPPNIIISEMRNDFSDLDYSFWTLVCNFVFLVLFLLLSLGKINTIKKKYF